MLTSPFGNLISLPIFNHSVLSSYQSNNVVHTIAEHNMLYTAYSWICQSCIVQSTFNSMETCLLTLIILADYLIATVHDD